MGGIIIKFVLYFFGNVEKWYKERIGKMKKIICVNIVFYLYKFFSIKRIIYNKFFIRYGI